MSALPTLISRRAVATYGRPEALGDIGELIVVGQFALRQRLERAPQSQPFIRPALQAEPVDAALPPAAGWEHRALMPLPTEGYLALRSETARHRQAAYASCA